MRTCILSIKTDANFFTVTYVCNTLSMPGSYSKRVSGEALFNCTFKDLENPWTFHALFLQNKYEVVRWLQRTGLLADECRCDKCDVYCNLCERKRNKDGLSWRCPSRRHEYSIRRNSFFERSHFPIEDIVQFVKCFLDGNTLLACAKFSGVDYKKTSVEWANLVRELCKQWVWDLYQNVQLEGEVEIDESLFGRRCKYHRGNPHGGLKVWIFGLVQRSNNKLLLFPVDKRDKATLIPIIQAHVKTGSRIFSDCWAAYRGLNDLGFEHFSVNHKVGFCKVYVNDETGEEVQVHTNRIEGCWKHAKQHFRKINGTSLANFEAHLAEIIWRNWHRENLYESFFELVKRYYDLEDEPRLNFGTPLFTYWSTVVQEDPENTTVHRRDSSDASDMSDGRVSDNDAASPVRSSPQSTTPLSPQQTSADTDPSDVPPPQATSTPAVSSSRILKLTKARKQASSRLVTSGFAEASSSRPSSSFPTKLPPTVTVRKQASSTVVTSGSADEYCSRPSSSFPTELPPTVTVRKKRLSLSQKAPSKGKQAKSKGKERHTPSHQSPQRGSQQKSKGKAKKGQPYSHPKGFKPKEHKGIREVQDRPIPTSSDYKKPFVWDSSDSDFV